MTAIQHQPEQQCFVVELNGSFAKLEYRLEGDDIVFTSTYVPFRLRGKGYAEQLVAQGLAWANQQGYKITTTCWYVEKYLADPSVCQSQ